MVGWEFFLVQEDSGDGAASKRSAIGTVMAALEALGDSSER